MISITISPEQLAAAPPDVRRLLEREMASTLAFAEGQQGAPKAPAAELAACSLEEVVQLFALIRDDHLTAALFCELGHEPNVGLGTPRYRAVSVADLLRRSRLGSPDRLTARLETIHAAFRRLRGDAGGSLFGFDQFGHLYIHEVTQHHIAELWQKLAAAEAATPFRQEPPERVRMTTGPSANGMARPAPGEADAALDAMLGTPL
jgi:hypothetical protein